MPTVFVCYRRGDTADLAGRLRDRLTERFGERNVYFDVDTVPRGMDFRVHMLQAVKGSDVVLALIGPRWLDGGRLGDENDYVRAELETALAHGVPIIPVLVAAAPMPSADDLPASLASLSYLNAALIQSGTDFSFQVARLIDDVEAIERPSPPNRGRRKLLAAVALSATVAVVGVIGVWRSLSNEGEAARPSERDSGKSIAPSKELASRATLEPEPSVAESAATGDTVQVAADTSERRLPGPGFATAEEAMEALARTASSALRERGDFQVAVGRFEGPAYFPASGGPRLQKILVDALTKAELSVVRRSGVTLTGSYSIVIPDPHAEGDARLGVAVEVRALDSLGGVLPEMEAVDPVIGVETGRDALATTIWDEREVCHLAGATVALPPSAGALERSRRLAEAIERPTASVSEERVSAAVHSPYSISVRIGGEPAIPAIEDGFAFVDLDGSDSYEVTLRNDSDVEAAAEVSIDGLNVFAFSRNVDERGLPRFRRFIISPRSALTLRGWQIDEDSVERFVIAEYSQSAASLIADDVDFGTITATFSAAWPKGEPPPSDEPAPAGNDSTGAAPLVEQSFAEVVRDVGVVRAVVSVRYDR